MSWQILEEERKRSRTKYYVTLGKRGISFCPQFVQALQLNTFLFSTIEIDEARKLIRFLFHSDRRGNASFKIVRRNKEGLTINTTILMSEKVQKILPTTITGPMQTYAQKCYMVMNQEDEIDRCIKEKTTMDVSGTYWVFDLTFNNPNDQKKNI